jgi:3-phenylpropionate/cinnamic acid dioxygenase small subunit
MEQERPAAGLDVAAIQNLVGRLAHLADDGGAADYLELYTDDAVWEFPGNPAVGAPPETRRGRNDIGEGVAQRRRAGLQGPGSATRHVVHTIEVDVTASDEATGVLYWMFYADTGKAPRLTSMGRYDDIYRMTATGWKLAHRRITVG